MKLSSLTGVQAGFAGGFGFKKYFEQYHVLGFFTMKKLFITIDFDIYVQEEGIGRMKYSHWDLTKNK